MKVVGIREFRAKTATLFGSGEAMLVTNHGKVSGIYVPLNKPDRLPENLRRELIGVLGRHLGKQLSREEITERNIKEDFLVYRGRRR